MLRALLLFLSLGLATTVCAAERAASAFGEVSVPSPARPTAAEQCVEPVEVMRRNHMKFLLHQRDATVIEGERGSKYSLTGCMDCHNPADDSGRVVRYEDPEHFCAECHAYTGVRIDCFECHADRGLGKIDQGRLAPGSAWHSGGQLTAATPAQTTVTNDVD